MADETIVYALDDGQNKWATLTKEQILTAITQAITEGKISNVDAGFITRIQEMNRKRPVHLWVGSVAEYEALETKDFDTIYIFNNDSTIPDLVNDLNETKETQRNIIDGSIEIPDAAYSDFSSEATLSQVSGANRGEWEIDRNFINLTATAGDGESEILPSFPTVNLKTSYEPLLVSVNKSNMGNEGKYERFYLKLELYLSGTYKYGSSNWFADMSKFVVIPLLIAKNDNTENYSVKFSNKRSTAYPLSLSEESNSLQRKNGVWIVNNEPSSIFVSALTSNNLKLNFTLNIGKVTSSKDSPTIEVELKANQAIAYNEKSEDWYINFPSSYNAENGFYSGSDLTSGPAPKLISLLTGSVKVISYEIEEVKTFVAAYNPLDNVYISVDTTNALIISNNNEFPITVFSSGGLVYDLEGISEAVEYNGLIDGYSSAKTNAPVNIETVSGYVITLSTTYKGRYYIKSYSVGSVPSVKYKLTTHYYLDNSLNDDLTTIEQVEAGTIIDPLSTKYVIDINDYKFKRSNPSTSFAMTEDKTLSMYYENEGEDPEPTYQLSVDYYLDDKMDESLSEKYTYSKGTTITPINYRKDIEGYVFKSVYPSEPFELTQNRSIMFDYKKSDQSTYELIIEHYKNGLLYTTSKEILESGTPVDLSSDFLIPYLIDNGYVPTSFEPSQTFIMTENVNAKIYYIKEDPEPTPTSVEAPTYEWVESAGSGSAIYRFTNPNDFACNLYINGSNKGSISANGSMELTLGASTSGANYTAYLESNGVKSSDVEFVAHG